MAKEILTTIPLERDSDFWIDPNTGREFYMPRSFKATTMAVGRGKVAVDTTWGEPGTVVDEDVADKISIAAPMRTLNGLSVMLVNLARNPDIRHVVLWTGGPYDRGKDALIPISYLKKLFDKENGGLDDDGKIKGTDFYLFPELVADGGADILRQVIANVDFVTEFEGEAIDSKEKLQRALGALDKDEGQYMEPHVFPEIKIKTPEVLASREVSPVICEHTIQQGWLRLMQHIIEYGPRRQLETGGAEVKEVRYARVIIDRQQAGTFQLEDWVGQIQQLGITPEKMEAYYNTKIRPEVNMVQVYDGVERFERPAVSYLYSELLHSYPRSKDLDNFLLQMVGKVEIGEIASALKGIARRPIENADEVAQKVLADGRLDDLAKAKILLEIYIPPVDQVKRIVDQIKVKPDDADKMFILWVPDTHGMQDRGRPCFTQGALLVRGGKIDMKINFRSHDIPKGWLENVYGAWRLLCDIAEETGYEVGQLIVDSESAHAYIADVPWVTEVVKEQVYDKPAGKVYQASEWADPRGNWSINVVDGQIVCVLMDPVNGKPTRQFVGRTAKSIMAEMRHLRVFDDPNHALDIGFQLANAEFSNLTGEPFVQDHSIDFRAVRAALTKAS